MTTKKNKTLDALDATKEIWQKMTFGSLVRSLRISDQISQAALAKKLGVSAQFLSDVEHDKKDIGINFAKKVAKTMNYSVEPLIELLFKEQLQRNKLNYIVELKKVS